MKKWIVLIALFCLPHAHKATGLYINMSTPGYSVAVINPTGPVATMIRVASGLSTMRVKDIEKMTGIKLSLKQKIAWSIYRSKLKKQIPKIDDTDGSSKEGRESKTLGILSLVTLFLPVASVIASIPLAIIAIVKGTKAKKINPNDRKAKTGIILGIITLALIAAAIILVAILLSTGGFFVL